MKFKVWNQHITHSLLSHDTLIDPHSIRLLTIVILIATHIRIS